MKKFMLTLLLLVTAFMVASCSNPKDGFDSYMPSGIRTDAGEFFPSGSAGRPSYKSHEYGIIDIGGEGEDTTGVNAQLPAGQLSAAAYSDNEHYDYWLKLLKTGQTEEENGVFASYYDKYNNRFITENRIMLTFTSGVPEKVELLNENDEIVAQSYPTKDGKCYLFLKRTLEEYKVRIYYQISQTSKMAVYEDKITTDKTYDMEEIYKGYKRVTENAIDLMFVIDTTGSMRDELRYIGAELSDVIEKVVAANEGVKIRVSVLIYRDQEDAYITRYSEFTTDISKQINFIKSQAASGGGDFEEAVEIALSEAVEKKWSNSNATKLVVFVADAPAHDHGLEKWSNAVDKFVEKGIRIITVASSGINKKTEYFFRCQSMLTGGIYAYLTDDSGIGGPHIVATTEESPTVEFLNSMLVRLINGYHKGTFEEPISYHNETNDTNDQDTIIKNR